MRAVLIASACLVMAISLSGCAAYTVASTAMDVTATVVGTTAHVVGAVVSYPFESSDSDKKSKGD